MAIYPSFTTLPNIFTNYASFGMNGFRPMPLPMPLSLPIPNIFNFSAPSFIPNFNFSFPNFSFPSFSNEVKKVSNTVSKTISNIGSSVKGSISKMLEVARAEWRKGVRETSKNDSVDIRKYKLGARNSQPWCAAFATWCAKQAGLCRNGLRWSMSSQDVKNAAGSKFVKKTNYKPKAGDFAIWTNVNDKSHGHIGIVDEVSNGYVYIIEGNTSKGTLARTRYSINGLKNTARFNGYVKTSEWVG